MPDLNIFSPIGRPDGITVADVRRALDQAGKRPLTVSLHSPGGSGFEALAIHSLLASHPAGVDVRIVGMAASAATVVAMAARPGGLGIVENGMMLLHDPMMALDGPAWEHDKAAELLRKVGEEFRAIYSKRSGLAPERLDQLLKRETWLTAAEAKALNLVDQVLPAARVAASWEPGRYFANPPTLHTKGITVTPATIAELKAALPGADPAFLVAQLESGATIEQARLAHLDAREALLTKREAELSAKAAAKPGTTPLAATTPGAPVTESADEFEELVAELTGKGMTRFQAVARASKRNPAAHEAHVRACNSPRVQSLITERFAL